MVLEEEGCREEEDDSFLEDVEDLEDEESILEDEEDSFLDDIIYFYYFLLFLFSSRSQLYVGSE